MPDSRWYALTVRPRHEQSASRGLRNKGLEEFSPVYRSRRRWSDRMKEVELCLFPGYVFCRFSYEDRLLVLGTPGIASIVGFARTPAPIPDSEIDAIQTLVRSERRVEPGPICAPASACALRMAASKAYAARWFGRETTGEW
jgi:Transcription antiterminator